MADDFREGTRIVFGSTAQENDSTNRPNHWAIEFNHYLVINNVLKPDQANILTSESQVDMSVPSELLENNIKKWQQPQTGFGESTDMGDPVGVNRYLSRLIYEEMFQISQPDGSGSQITSAGGLITHIDKGSIPGDEDNKKVKFLINSANRVRTELGDKLNANLSEGSKNDIAKSLGIDVNDLPITVEECFIKTWNILKEDIIKTLKTNEKDVSKEYLKKLLSIRSVPEFQFLFKSPFFWITLDKNKV